MERFIRVDLPVDSPEDTFKLCKKIAARHTALGAGSPLTGFVDMVAFATNHTNAASLYEQGDNNRETAQAKRGQALKKCGIAKGQNKSSVDTLYWYVLQVRDILLVKNRNEEDNLEEWGFTVVISQTGARRNVRVDIPDDTADELTSLAEEIIEKHTALGAGSPLTGNVDITDFETKTTDSRTLVDEAEAADADAQALHGQALNLLGYADGQTSDTEGTLYYDIINIRDRLLQVYQGEEDNMEPWGFKVIIGGSTTGGSGAGSSAVFEGDVPGSAVQHIALGDINPSPASTVVFDITGSTLRFYASPNAGDPPGGIFYERAPGTTTISINEFSTLLGFNSINNKLNVQNQGVSVGHYKLTFTGLQS